LKASLVDVVEANFACGSPEVLTKHAVLLIDSFELNPCPGICLLLKFHKIDMRQVGSELIEVPDPGQRKVCWR